MPANLTPDDLQSAVEAGVIDAAQAEKLKAMRTAAARPAGPDGEPAVLADEERFRFLNGFNDVFLTIGVLLVAGAFITAAAPSFSGSRWIGVMGFAAATFWALSEILVRRLRAVLPGMVLAVLFVIFAAAAVVMQVHSGAYAPADFDVYSELAFWRNPTLLFGVPALAAALLFYWRFHLPFTLALVAIFSYVITSRALVELAGISSPLIAFAFGLVVLAVALAYDARDPQRVTRLSDCAFWLHLVAAPLIVSPVITMIRTTTGGSGAASAVVLAIVLLLGLFALAIDRRALLVSSLMYFTFAVYDLLSGGMPSTPGSAMPSSFVLTLALVGGFVLILGVYWHPLRSRLMPLFKNTGFAPYLPPARP